MKVTLAFADVAVIVLFFAAVLLVGFRSRLAKGRRGGSEQGSPASNTIDYLLAGRSLTTPVFVMTLVSTWYGGILGVGEFSYLYGVSNWVVQGVPYYFFALIFAFL